MVGAGASITSSAASRRDVADPALVVLLFSEERAERLDGLDDAPDRGGASELLWIDAQRASAETARSIAKHLELDEDACRALASTTKATGFRDGGRFVHLTVHTPDAPGSDAQTEIECIFGESWVVTAHDGPVAVLEEFAALASGSGPVGELDGPSFVASLLEWVLNEYAMAFERLEEELEELDERAMRGKRTAEEEIEELVGLRRRTGRLRRALVAHRSPLLALAHPELEALGDSASAERFQALLSRYEATVQTARDARESIVSSFDVVIARTGHRTNEIMKILTLASVILLPGSVIAGVMGMNFKVPLFEQTNLFWLVVAVIAAIAVVTLTTARLRDWI